MRRVKRPRRRTGRARLDRGWDPRPHLPRAWRLHPLIELHLPAARSRRHHLAPVVRARDPKAIMRNRIRDAVGEEHRFVFVVSLTKQKQNSAVLRLRRGNDLINCF